MRIKRNITLGIWLTQEELEGFKTRIPNTNLNQITRLANEGSLTIIGDNIKNINKDLKSMWK